MTMGDGGIPGSKCFPGMPVSQHGKNLLAKPSRRRFMLTGPRESSLLYSPTKDSANRSEEHTPELQSRQYLVCRLLLEKKKLGQGAFGPSLPPSGLKDRTEVRDV